MSWPFAFYLFSRHYGNMPTWPMLILNLFESHKLFAPFLKLAAFEPDDAFLWHQFSAVGEIWFSTQTRGQIYICYSLKPKTWKSELLRIPYICCWMSLFWLTGGKTEISIANLKTEEKGRYYQNSKHKICIRKERRHQNPGSAALLTSLLRAGSGLLSESGRQINLFRGLKRHKFPQRANTEPPVILFCRRWMKEEIGEEGEDGWGIMRENEAVISSWYFLSHRAAGNRRPRSLSLKVQKSAREIWSDALGKIWCKQAQELQMQIVRGANIIYKWTNTTHKRTNTKYKRTNTKRKRANKKHKGEKKFHLIVLFMGWRRKSLTKEAR